MSFFKDLIDSFKADDKGFSARKLSAFAGLCVAGYLTIMRTDSPNTPALAWSWLIFILICLGLVTAQQILQLRGVPSNVTTTEQTVKTTTSTPSKTEPEADTEFSGDIEGVIKPKI